MPPQLGGFPLGGAPLGGTQGESGTPSTTQYLTGIGIASTVVFPSPTVRLLWHHTGQTTPPENLYRMPLLLRARAIDPTTEFGTPTIKPRYILTALAIGSDGRLGVATLSINTERIDEEALLQLLAA